MGLIVPAVKEMTGRIAGVAQMRPSDDPRAIEPMLIHLEVWPENLKFRGLTIGATFTAYGNRNRLVLDQSFVAFADGAAMPWVRVSRQEGGQWATHAMVDFTNLDLNQLVRAVNAEADPMPGRLDGSVTLLGNLRKPDELVGEGTIAITRSDLANWDIFQVLYNAMRLNLGDREPDGSGEIEARLEQSKLMITRMRYFNRGVEARMSATIDKVWDMPDSPINGFVIGTVRPLANIYLPGVTDADAILSSLQRYATTIPFDGTVAKPRPVIRPFGEIGEGFRAFILGEVESTR